MFRSKQRTWPEDISAKKYDYIVAGGGTAGSIVAARLSEDPDVSVLLLEAGGEPSAMSIAVPAMQGDAQLNPELDWMVRSTPQEHACQGLTDRVSFWPRGKVLGGSSCLNTMLYVRGNRENFDEWRDQFGCDGWGYDDVLPYFKKAERSTISGLDPKYHGSDGPMTISQNPDTFEVSHAFVKACEELGLKNGDYNGANQNNVAQLVQHNVTDNGTRDHVAKCYLEKARTRPNLTVTTYAHVTRVVIDSNNRAVGVAYKLIPKEGMSRDELGALPEYLSACNREVIVCGGAVHSPQILMLSGLGPREQLEQHGIRCLVDLPMIGQNLQDHLLTFVSYNAKGVTLSNQSKLRAAANIARYFLTGGGALRSTLVEAMSFHSTKVRPDLAAKDVPDLQIHFTVISIPEPKGEVTLRDHFNINHDFADSMDYTKGWKDDGYTFMPTLLHPKSVGEIRLKSSSAFDNPIVDPHYLEHPDDMRVMVEGVKVCERLAETKSLKDHTISRRPFHTNPHTPGTEEYYEKHVRDFTCTVYHPVGTVAMGKDPSKAALTPDLKVRGVTGLRVADCSVMPTITSGNTHAPAIMIGEKCADLIKAEWSSTPLAKL